MSLALLTQATLGTVSVAKSALRKVEKAFVPQATRVDRKRKRIRDGALPPRSPPSAGLQSLSFYHQLIEVNEGVAKEVCSSGYPEPLTAFAEERKRYSEAAERLRAVCVLFHQDRALRYEERKGRSAEHRQRVQPLVYAPVAQHMFGRCLCTHVLIAC